jgi:Xaa-Pro aminopeptidase
MREVGVDVLAVSAGPDLIYLTGYEAMPLERLTMLVVARDGDAVLLVPRLEVPRVDADTPGFTVEAWDETDDPIERIAKHAGGARVLALGDHVFARDVLALQGALPDARFVLASHVTSPLRIVKDEAELGALRDAATAVDEIAQDMRDWSFRGRTERAIHRQLIEQILDRGHERANFAIVATGPNAASPHHEPGDRRIEPGVYLPGRFGLRLEDIVIATPAGPQRLNHAPRDLAVVD